MKYFLLVGGFIGFVVAFVSGWNAGNSPAVVLRDATVACFVGGMLFRLLHAAFISGLKAKLLDRSRFDVAAEPPEEEEARPRARRRRA
jgi:hypothetical protein